MVNIPVGPYAALGLDPAGHPLIAFNNPTLQGGILDLARFDGLRWQIATLDSGAVGAYRSLQIDPQGAGAHQLL